MSAARVCTCTGSCKGAAGLGEGWRCALTPASSEPAPSALCVVCGKPGLDLGAAVHPACAEGERKAADVLKALDRAFAPLLRGRPAAERN